ncbi:MAG: FAD-dependent oxidoreductase [Odoribacteraceae bacterium]|jgi:glycine/D-amino acid oxidase-like deaminating enzyme/NAD-dependent dihydropyrimidine dehydrogenase PreA subunit|nr:FAD-dependent oxidoreductase [Odoribacteraceae bacterium]
MQKIKQHPILDVPSRELTRFTFNGAEIEGERGFTIAAALHQAGFPAHGHSPQGRPRSLACGIGKCGACEMLVDGRVRRVCMTKVDGVREVREIRPGEMIAPGERPAPSPRQILHARVVIIGAGPAGLAAREEFEKRGVDAIVIDNNDKVGGQFNMQTHQFFFFEKEKRFGGMRGFDIARSLAGETSGIYLNATVWDILEGKRVAVKRLDDDSIFYVDADYLVVATGAVPFMPAFENDDLPGVYTAAVVQKMMNNELTLLGKRVLTIGAGNIGYLTSYQLMQAGATVKAIIEAMPREGGFPVQANRVRRLAIPILTSRVLLKAIPDARRAGVAGAVIARCENFKPVPGTETVIDGIDAINVCTGLIPDNHLFAKGKAVFGERCFAAGDAVRIGEGTSAVLRGKQVAIEIMMEMGERLDYGDYLAVSREYIDSQQHPVKVLDSPLLPGPERRMARPFALLDCLYGFACNPCSFACPQGAIAKNATSAAPVVDHDKCTGCMECVYQCPGLAIFGYDLKRNVLFLPVEYEVNEQEEVYLVDNNGSKIGEGIIEKVMRKPNKTRIARVKALDARGDDLLAARGFIVRSRYPRPLLPGEPVDVPGASYVCHCEDVPLDDVLPLVGDRPFISIDEVKHATRLGMGPCRGKRCIPRLRALLRARGVQLVGDATPRAPLSNQLNMSETYPAAGERHVIVSRHPAHRVDVGVLIAGGGMAGSALFRYMAGAGLKPLLLNDGHGSSWRNIAGGRTAFSLPELAEIADRNHAIFRELQALANIDYKPIRYVNFAHDQETYRALDASRAWSNARMIAPDDFRAEISPHFNPSARQYLGALVTNDCWQAAPGKVIDLLRRLGTAAGGTIAEGVRVIDAKRDGENYRVLTVDRDGRYAEYRAGQFVNAAGAGAGKICESLGIQHDLYPVRHQAFITRPLPMLGKGGENLDMLIDRRLYKGFSAIYGQQLACTGQVIGCASPAVDPARVDKPLVVNTREFIELFSEVFVDWIPALANAGIQATWSGYYAEPRYIIDPDLGLFTGLRGHGFMLSQYLAKMYVDKLTGRPVPAYFDDLKLSGPGLSEKAFK